MEKVYLGDTEYIHDVNEKGEETLTRYENMGGKEMKIVVKSVATPEESKKVEKYITDVLGNLYIERILKELEENKSQ